ncbi:hypothetical protein [Rhodosalinus sediminis]|uniref:hypothetical protein n=1 Tax=Rhodosalinus sediminis TaxID=1940533 RepID=UPI00235560BF|nr:hypothetical protein [Rhodosalinus sediminis]
MAVGAIWLGRGVLAGAAMVLLLVPVPEQERTAQASGSAVGAAVEAIMTEVDSGEMEADAERAAGEHALRAAGDICLMRHRKLLPGIDRDLRRRFAAASLAAHDGGIQILREIEAEAEGAVAWRAALEIARIEARAGSRQAARVALARAQAINSIPRVCRSDMALLAARLASDRTSAGRHLDAAVAADPAHFTAHVERALAAASARAETPEACVVAVRRIMESVVYLERLTRSSTQLLRIKGRAARLAQGTPELALLAGFVHERIGREAAARGTYRAALAKLRSGPCAPAFRQALTIRLGKVVPG